MSTNQYDSKHTQRTFSLNRNLTKVNVVVFYFFLCRLEHTLKNDLDR